MFSFISKANSYTQPLHASVSLQSENPISDAPLKEGDLAPDFTFSANNWLGLIPNVTSVRDIKLRDLHQKPLVVVFYSVYWNGYGINFLKRIEKLQQSIEETANILIVTPEPPRKLLKAFNGYDFTFNFYHDPDQLLAEKFGVFSEEKPTWNLFSGIDTNIPLLSAYVINSAGQISFSHIEDFSGSLPEGDLLTAVNEEGRLAS